ncbi:hypothetical protein [Maritimibacter sp. DP1N21-5]|uniref:hypothetical protein n=1 Tax=Maritimibacter sp. DP1N21-5 TaxID=2836867 RepID=UPI001C4715BD|nr:hypothetical protein [Maritimibacter sp. DP1N21-5]MBV7408665.1 hypothetical protein [Maritimibacter sp. DP1N21-5]
MATSYDVISGPPPQREFRLAGTALTAVTGGMLLWLAQTTDLVALMRSPVVVLLVLPVALGVMLIWLGVSGSEAKRRLARVDALGVQAGVFGLLPWDQVGRIERRGSGKQEVLVVLPNARKELRRIVPIGRSTVAPDRVLADVLAVVAEAGMTATYREDAHPGWDIAPTPRAAREVTPPQTGF